MKKIPFRHNIKNNFCSVFIELSVVLVLIAIIIAAVIFPAMKKSPSTDAAGKAKQISGVRSSGKELLPPRPGIFKKHSPENFRMITFQHFRPSAELASEIVDDPESRVGKAIKATPDFGGKVIPAKVFPDDDNSVSVTFSVNDGTSVKNTMTFKEVPVNEKYHWYRMSGKVKLNEKSYFTGQNGAIKADLSHWYSADRDANEWDQIWFSAKFTGPAYVPDSRQKNAVYVDMIAVVREADRKLKLITLGSGPGVPSMTRHNSCSYLQTPNGGYLIDAGGPVSAALVRKKINNDSIRAVFITHMHEDHFGGLTGFLKDRMRTGTAPTWRGFWPEVWLPEEGAAEAFDKLMAMQYKGANRNHVNYRLVKPGLFYDDGYVKVTAIPNRHFNWRNKKYPSYSFLFDIDGKKLLCTGDLRSDCSDFPVEAAADADLCLVELTHFSWKDAMKYFKQIKPGKVVFNHVGVRMEQSFPEAAPELPFPAAIARDGDEFEF